MKGFSYAFCCSMFGVSEYFPHALRMQRIIACRSWLVFASLKASFFICWIFLLFKRGCCMGLSVLSKLLVRRQVKLSSLRGKRLAIDTYIHLHQFLKTMPRLTNKRGEVTTHLAGLFYRTIHLLSLGIKPVFVFDGPFPEIRRHERIVLPTVARVSSTVSQDVVDSSKELLGLLGVPVVQGPSEGEAQAAFLARKGVVFAVGSQDFDCLLFGAPRMVSNVTMAKTKKTRGGVVLVNSYLYDLQENLRHLGISHDQFVALAMLVGTDFNPGVEGVGPKRGLELVHRYNKRFDKLFRFVPWRYQYTWKEVFDCIRTMPVTNKYRLKWKSPDVKGLERFLVETHDFSALRVRNALRKLE